ncbi:MAG: hypothetical protein ABJA78_02015 [Ferruginibacter sp.]
MKFFQTISFCIILILLMPAVKTNAQSGNRSFIDETIYKKLIVKPRITDAAIHNWDTAHIVYYDPAIKNNKILLWLTGTNGTTNNMPGDFLNLALEKGYRVIALSFISVPAVSEICIGDALSSNINCAADFRRRRIYGDNNFSLIPDEPQDAIIPRLVKLLKWLAKNDAAGNWSQYLETNSLKPAWNKIAIAGQSQGGGMAEFIAQRETVARVISFSGGWDYSNSKEKKIARWYADKSITPMKNWYATYNINELAAKPLEEICTTLHIPAENIFALDKPLLNTNTAGHPNPYHVDGIRNPAYRSVWISMLGSGL